MTELTYRVIAGQRVPLELVPRLIEALIARYPDATNGITDPDEAGRAAMKAWIVETLADHEEAKARAPLTLTVAQTVAKFEDDANAARAKALSDAAAITDDVS